MLLLAPSLSEALNRSPDLNSRVNGMKAFLQELKYLYLNFSEYDNGLSNKFTLDSTARELKEHAAYHLAKNKEVTPHNSLVSNFILSLSELARYYVTCINLMAAMEIPNYDLEEVYIKNIYYHFRSLVSFENGLAGASEEEVDTFFALHSVKF